MAYSRLRRSSDQRKALLRDLVTDLILNGQIETTLAKAKELKKLADYDLLIPSRVSRLKEIEDWFAPLDIVPNIVCRLAHMQNAIELTRQGVGIAIFPGAVADYISDDIVVKKITHPDVYAAYVCVRDKERKLSMVAEKFWETYVSPS